MTDQRKAMTANLIRYSMRDEWAAVREVVAGVSGHEARLEAPMPDAAPVRPATAPAPPIRDVGAECPLCIVGGKIEAHTHRSFGADWKCRRCGVGFPRRANN